MPNAATLNAATLNGSAGAVSNVEDYDWEAISPRERQIIYRASVGSVTVPMTSFQSTMRLAGQSFLQMIVPNGDAFIESLSAESGSLMIIKRGFLYADGTISPLETIATAPFQILRSDDGQGGLTLTLSGYGPGIAGSARTRELRGITYRSINQGGRRVRCDIDLFLRPGHTALDADGTEFAVGVIQYYVGASSEAMEVIEDG